MVLLGFIARRMHCPSVLDFHMTLSLTPSSESPLISDRSCSNSILHHPHGLAGRSPDILYHTSGYRLFKCVFFCFHNPTILLLSTTWHSLALWSMVWIKFWKDHFETLISWISLVYSAPANSWNTSNLAVIPFKLTSARSHETQKNWGELEFRAVSQDFLGSLTYSRNFPADIYYTHKQHFVY